jgi:1-acyl-sn-glycerol-3-phosphate acyltransferase
VVTAFGYLLLLFGKIVLFFSRKQLIKWRNLLVRAWARIVVELLGIKINIKGAPPKPPFYLVANHLSYIDIVLLFTQVNCAFVAKAELQNWPVFGFLMKAVNTLFIDRNSKKDIPRVNARIEKAMRESDGIAIFPEGTSSKGSEVLPFKPALLEFAAQNGLSVSYATIHYSTAKPDPPAYFSVCWWGDMTFVDHFIDLLKLKRIRATVQFGRNTIRGNDRKALANELWHRVNRQFVPTAQMESQCPTSSMKIFNSSGKGRIYSMR